MANVSTEASLQTKLRVWFSSVPFVTRCTLVVCLTVYVVSSFIGYDDMGAVCLAAAPVLQGQVYRFLTAALFHGGILHLTFNMLALAPIGSSLERGLGSLQFLWIMLLLCTLGGAAYVLIAYLSSFLPASGVGFLDFYHQCAVGFSSVIFGLVLVDNHISAAATRSIFGFFSVPAKAYPYVLLVMWQLLVPRASFLGHLTGLLVGQLYAWGLLRWALPSSSTYQRIEGSAACSSCLRSSGFIAHTAGSGGDSMLPVSRPSGTGYQSLGTGSPGRSSGWLRGSWMPFPPSSDRLAALLHPSQPQQPAQAAPQGTRLGGGQQPMDAKAAAAAAAEARLAGGSSSGKSSKGGSGSNGGSASAK